jgi:membrane protein
MNRIPLKEVAPLVRATVLSWQNDRAPRMGAALAYYMALSLAPTLVIILAVTSLAFGAKAAQGRLVGQIHAWIGYEGAAVIQSMIEGARRSSRGLVTTVVGLATLFFGATAVVTELRDAMNTIWKVPLDTASSRALTLFNLVKDRLLSFALVLGAGLFLLTSLIVTTWISAAGKYLSAVPAPPRPLMQTVDWVVSFALITALFAFIFKVLPAVHLEWDDVGIGAVLTSILFTAGKLLLGVYFGRAGFADSYGAAGSLIFFLVWVYYSAQVVYLGAEFTRAYALRFGSISPARLDPTRLYAESYLHP